MPRRPRCVLPGFPYHVTQRGVDRREAFLIEEDRALGQESSGDEVAEVPDRPNAHTNKRRAAAHLFLMCAGFLLESRLYRPNNYVRIPTNRNRSSAALPFTVFQNKNRSGWEKF
jgi:hypothetical protein